MPSKNRRGLTLLTRKKLSINTNIWPAVERTINDYPGTRYKFHAEDFAGKTYENHELWIDHPDYFLA
jgi:hypothetical protein